MWSSAEKRNSGNDERPGDTICRGAIFQTGRLTAEESESIMKRNEGRNPFLPAYARTPLALAAVVGLLAYYGSRLIAQGAMHHDFTLPVDGRIPFAPIFSLIYVLAYVQWGVGLLLIARERPEICRRVMAGEIISKLICMALFILVPTTMVRAEIASGDVFSRITGFLYAIDAPDNLFPSIHCMDSWTCFRGAQRMERVGKWYMRFSLAFTLLVFASTVLIKQHVIVDVFAGILVAEIGQYLSRKFPVYRIFERIDALLK